MEKYHHPPAIKSDAFVQQDHVSTRFVGLRTVRTSAWHRGGHFPGIELRCGGEVADIGGVDGELDLVRGLGRFDAEGKALASEQASHGSWGRGWSGFGGSWGGGAIDSWSRLDLLASEMTHA